MIIVTGAAGFIGYHASAALLREGEYVIGVDNLNDYYDPLLKRMRLEKLMEESSNFRFLKLDLSDRDETARFFASLEHIETIVHLAAQAGVQWSLTHPHLYVDSNLSGFVNVCEGARMAGVRHLIYASSSSVYGNSKDLPFSEHSRRIQPVSLYAATKVFNEAVAFSYSHNFGIRTTGLRFFTVYGPWGRPDMSYWKFTDAILSGQTIRLHFYGDARRDFTYVEDATSALLRIVRDARELGLANHELARIYNVGTSASIRLMDFVRVLESVLGRAAEIKLVEARSGDVFETCADVTALKRDYGYVPDTPIDFGLKSFAEWFQTDWMPVANTAEVTHTTRPGN